MATIEESLNPQNHKQRHIFYSYWSAHDAGEDRHAGHVIRELATKCGFTIIGAVSQSMMDGWDYWIEAENVAAIELPAFIDSHRWKPINCR